MDPLDLSWLEAAVDRALDSLKKQITAVRKGGRDAAAIEALQVSLTKSGGKTFKVGDVAQVVPRGRVLAVIVGEKEVWLFSGFFHFIMVKEIEEPRGGGMSSFNHCH